MSRPRRFACSLLMLVVLAATGVALAQKPSPGSSLTPNGRQLTPAGRLTTLGAFPTGGAITPDGRFYWAVDAGRGENAVRVIELGSGDVRQTLPIPGGYVGVAFSPDGKQAFVSGQPADSEAGKKLKGPAGDVIHVYSVDTRDGSAAEREPIKLPAAPDGAAANDELPGASGVPSWPEGMTVMPDGRHLVVVLGQADRVAIVDLSDLGSPKITQHPVGAYPYGVAADPKRPRVYVTNERDGTVSVVEVPSGRLLDTIAVGGPKGNQYGGNRYAHPQGITADPKRDRMYVAVTDRDLVAVLATDRPRLLRYVDVARPEAIGVAPVQVAVAPEGDTLYVANAGEDAVAGIALSDRPEPGESVRSRGIVRVRSAKSIARYRRGLKRAQARRARRKVSRRVHARRVRALKRRYLNGKAAQACGGPTRAAERRYIKRVQKALRIRDQQARRKVSRKRRTRAFKRRVTRAKRALPKVRDCPPPGFLPGADTFQLLGRLPTAAYTTDVEVSPDGKRLVWLAAKGVGTGPNPDGKGGERKLLGRAGALARPTDRELVAFTPRADRQVVPSNATAPPPGTPVVAPGGGASTKIKYVFYVVRENRTYDQIFGSEPRGDGDPRLQLFDDNGVPGPAGGVTPNAHALARRFPLLDNVFANSEESTAGHKISAGGYVNDYTTRTTNTSRGRKGNPDIFPIGVPPNGFVFDQAARQGVPYRVYGEQGAANQPFGDDGRPTFGNVVANTDTSYPPQLFAGCRPADQEIQAPNPARCTADAGEIGLTAGPPATLSRLRAWNVQFQTQIAAGTVPAFNYFVLYNDHTNGTRPGVYTPKAMIADNDLALGQLVEQVSNSPIWKESAILVTEDDSQDGIDHVDAHRMPAFVISPWARKGAVVSTRYDQYSFLRTAELMTGLRPLSINDAFATPLYDAFISGDQQPDVEGTRYRAIQPQQSLTEVNPANAPNARLSSQLPWEAIDYVPQRLADRILWQSVYGSGAEVPAPGPGASSAERARATGAIAQLRRGRSARRFLLAQGEGESEAREKTTASLIAAASGLTEEEAEERIESFEGKAEEDEERKEKEEP